MNKTINYIFAWLILSFVIVFFIRADSIKDYSFFWPTLALVVLSYYVFNKQFSVRIFRELSSYYNNYRGKVKKLSSNKDNLFIVVLVGIFLLGLGLRFWQIDFLAPTRDEFGHLVAAKRWVQEGYFDYLRGWEITYLVGFLFKVFDHSSLLIARTVPAIFGSLTTISIFYLGRRISTRVGLWSAFLWAVCPLAIGLSRYIREYAFYTFYLTIAFLYAWYYADNLKKIRFDWKGILKTIILAIPLIYAFLPGVGQTQKIIIPLIFTPIVLQTILLIRDQIKDDNKKMIGLFTAGIIAIMIGLIIYFEHFFHLSIDDLTIGFNQGVLRSFFFSGVDNPSWIGAQWFFGSHLPTWFLIGIFILPSIFLYRKKSFAVYNLIFWFSFIAFTYFYNFVTNHKFGSRIVFFMIPFFVVIYGSALDIVFMILKKWWTRNKIAFLAGVILIFIVFNPLTSVRLIKGEENGQIDPKQGTWQPDIKRVAKILDQNGFRPTDILVSDQNTFPAFYWDYKFIEEIDNWPNMFFSLRANQLRGDNPVNIYWIKRNRSRQGYQRLIKAIKPEQRGWIITKGGPRVNPMILVTNKPLELVGIVNGAGKYHIYRWEK